MTKETAFYVAIFATAAMAIGWFWRGLRGANHELAATLRKIAGLKDHRDRLAGTFFLVLVLAGAVLWVVANSHGHGHK
jgi:hypothetical protein